MTSCSKLEEETNVEGVSKENCSEEIEKIVAARKAMPVSLKWGQIFNLPSETCQHMVIALQHQEVYAKKVKDVVKMAEMPAQCGAYNIAVTFTDDD